MRHTDHADDADPTLRQQSQPAAYSPLPWVVGQLDDGTLVIHNEGDKDSIAELPYGGPAHEPRQRANADLLCAAPDLLEQAMALRCLATSPRFQAMTVRDALREMQINDCGYNPAAIAKATGGAN